MKPFTVSQVDHIVLRVRDMHKSLRFYVDILGLEIARRNDHYSMIHIRAGASMIDLIDVEGLLGRQGGEPAGSSGRNVDHFCLRIDPFDEAALIRYFAQFDITVGRAESRYGAEGEGLSVYCIDPDGNTVELKGPSVDPQG